MADTATTRLTPKRLLVVGISLAFGLTLSVLLIDRLLEIQRDRQFGVIIRGPVRVYQTPLPPSPENSGQIMRTVSQSEHLEVLWITRRTEYEAIKVRLPDGAVGYIFCCENFELTPP